MQTRRASRYVTVTTDVEIDIADFLARDMGITRVPVADAWDGSDWFLNSWDSSTDDPTATA